MTYFAKSQTNELSSIVPLIILPLIYSDLIENNIDQKGSKYWIDDEGNFITNEISLILYSACWQLSSLLIADLIEDKLSYEKTELNMIQKLSPDLGADSLDLVEIALYLEKAIGIPIHEKLHFDTVSDLIDYLFSIMACRIQNSILFWPKSNNKLILEW